MSAVSPPPAAASERTNDRGGRPLVPPLTTVELPALTTLLTLAVCGVVVTALDLARDVLIPITLSVLLSFVLAPLVNLLRRLHLGRVPSVLLAVIVALGLILAIGGLIGTQIADLVGEVPRYQHTIEHKVGILRQLTVGQLDNIVDRLSHQFAVPAAPAPDAKDAAPGSSSPTDANLANRPPMPVEVHQPNPSPLELAGRVIAPVVGPLSTTAIVFIVAIFILLQREDLRDRLIRLFGSGDLHRTTVAMNDAAKRLSRYFLAQLAVNTGFGAVVSIGLLVIGVPSPVLWGIMAGLLRFLPYLGAPLAAVLPMALAAAVDPGWSMVLWTGGLFLAVEGLTGQVVEPMLYSHSTGLSPVSVVVAATFWTWLWGPIGLIMSTPLTLCLVVLGRYVQRLEFLEVLLGDRPALTPVESFYQRMLAGDADEAYDQAETLLRQRSLCSYYDDVAMHGLRMAADDRLRNVLSDLQVQRIQNAFDGLVRDLDDHKDAQPETKGDNDPIALSRAEQSLPKPESPPTQAPPKAEMDETWRRDGAVLCIAGRGPLDESAASMLAQLLVKHGLGARVLPNADVAPRRLVELDLSQVAMACVCYLEVSGAPSHVRYLVRRLRQRRRNVPILVGLWRPTEEALEDTRHQALLGADHYVATLRDAVEICVFAAAAETTSDTPDELVASGVRSAPVPLAAPAAG